MKKITVKGICSIETMLSVFILQIPLTVCSTEKLSPNNPLIMNWTTPDIPSLSILSISHLRNRQYGSQFVKPEAVDNNSDGYSSFIMSYKSDGLTNYARIDIPQKTAPVTGYPVLLYSHGWVGIKSAPSFNFFLDQEGSQATYIDRLAKQGYVVVTPGWRGHGTVNNVPAQGIEFMQRWDNASYISPIFYAIDMLNALDSIQSITSLKLGPSPINIDTKKVFLSGHSQGGDTALLVLAIAGESSTVKQQISAASIFSGCFLPRLKQGELYSSMSTSPQAFLAGDGRWTSSATGYDGQVNPDFQFGFPADWIGTPHSSDWTWQNKTWSSSTVKQAFKKKYDEMYHILQKDYLTADFYTLETNNMGRTVVQHPNHIKAAYAATSAIYYPQYLQEPLALHHSDRDYYSLSKWNQALVQTILKSGGNAVNFEYPGNTHSLTISQHQWFSENYNQIGLEQMISHDINWFNNPKK
ncbi:MAG: dienelactone hydrolase [Paraglaciecola sp.]|jgi:dienelactone hydrolase